MIPKLLQECDGASTKLDLFCVWSSLAAFNWNFRRSHLHFYRKSPVPLDGNRVQAVYEAVYPYMPSPMECKTQPLYDF